MLLTADENTVVSLRCALEASMVSAVGVAVHADAAICTFLYTSHHPRTDNYSYQYGGDVM